MFVLVEVLYKNREYYKYPCTKGSPLFQLCYILNKSDNVIAFIVSEVTPVTPELYGWSSIHFNKWVLEFTSDMFGG